MTPDVEAAARLLFEGARPTIARLAALAGMDEAALARIAAAAGWRPLPAPDGLRRRVAAMADRALTLLETAEGDALFDKPRLDVLTALLKAIDRLGEQIALAEERGAGDGADIVVADAFAAIDRRIEELAHAYAERLVEAASDGGATPSG